MDFKSSSWLSRSRAKRKRSEFSLIVSQNASNNTFDYHFNEGSSSACSGLDKREDDNYELFNKLPIDWSLKERIRFSSATPFPYEGQFKASEDASGLTSFVRCIPSKEQMISAINLENEKDIFSPSKRMMRTPDAKMPKMNQQTETSQLDTSETAELRRFCFTWIYPNLPWLTLFPRIQNRLDRKSNLNTTNNKSIKEQLFKDSKSEVCQQLRDDWYSSLKSLYHLIRARQCAFFYVCANNFTILFRATGVSSIDSMHAIITPTTTGLRTMLKEEGINFTMPLYDETKDENSDQLDSVDDELNEGNDDSGVPVEEDSQIFLESLGLSQQDFPTVKKKVKASAIDREDKRKTLVLIKGRDTNLLLTFLSNTDVIIPTTGPLIGIPPTLLAPVAFSGASLHPLKLKTSHLMHNNQLIYSLDLIGPILPNVVYDLMKFFEVKKAFNSLIVNSDATSPFTEFSSTKGENAANLMSLFASENLKDCGLSKDLVTNICQRKQQSKLVLKNVQFDSSSGYRVQL